MIVKIILPIKTALNSYHELFVYYHFADNRVNNVLLQSKHLRQMF